LHQSGLFWLTIVLIVGTSFCFDCLIEYISIEYFATGSDYVRKYMKNYFVGYGWNDLEGPEIVVTDKDVAAIRSFMVPI